MENLVIPYSFVAHTPAIAAQQNANIQAISTYLNTTGVGRYQANSITTAAIGDGQIDTRTLQGDSVTNDKLALSVDSDTTAEVVFLTTSYQDVLTLSGLTTGTYLILVNAYADVATSSGTKVGTRVNVDSGGSLWTLAEEVDAGEYCGGIVTSTVNSAVKVQAKKTGGGAAGVALNPARLLVVRIA